MLIPFGPHAPRLAPGVHVQPGAQIIGDVEIGADSSIWFNVVLRGDVHYIRIGARSNIQDNVTVHVTTGTWPTLVGDDVTVGHGAILHGCRIGNRCLIGMGAIVMDNAQIGDDCLVAAGALVTPGTVIPPGHLVLGSPAKVGRVLRPGEHEHIARSARGYVELAASYRRQGSIR